MNELDMFGGCGLSDEQKEKKKAREIAQDKYLSMILGRYAEELNKISLDLDKLEDGEAINYAEKAYIYRTGAEFIVTTVAYNDGLKNFPQVMHFSDKDRCIEAILRHILR
jgi:hypothetical protein